jgi:hypothetical protein
MLIYILITSSIIATLLLKFRRDRTYLPFDDYLSDEEFKTEPEII